MITASAVCALLLLACGSGARSELPGVEAAAQLDSESLEITIDGELFTRIHFAAEPRPYLYPLFAEGSIPVTRGYPMEIRPNEAEDHPHHQSLWYAHGDVNGHDFWHSPDVKQELIGKPVRRERNGWVDIELHYRWAAADEVLLTEERMLSFGTSGGARVIDFTVTLAATEGEVVFGDTKEGSMALRLHPQLRVRGEVASGEARNSEGHVGSDVWGKKAAWVAYYGPVDGEEVVVAMLDHPSNPRHPTWWHARDYGLFAANPFGAHDFEGGSEGAGDLHLPEGSESTFRYRILIARGAFDEKWLQGEFERYSQSP